MINKIVHLFKKKKKPIFEYGYVEVKKGSFVDARKNIKTGEVQFILWLKGEQGNNEDYWHCFDRSHWNKFTSTEYV